MRWKSREFLFGRDVKSIEEVERKGNFAVDDDKRGREGMKTESESETKKSL